MKKLFFVVLSLFLLFHSSMTILYNSPINPLKLKLNNVVNSYMGTLFTQNWHLFAPNPVSTNMNVIARGLYTDENGKEKMTDWLNITKTFTTDLQSNRFDINRLNLAAIRTASSSVYNAQAQDKDFFTKYNDKNDSNLHAVYDISERNINQYYDKKNVQKMEVRIVVETFPEYGKNGDVKKSYITLPTKNI